MSFIINVVKNASTEMASVGAGALAGTYVSCHDPLNLNNSEDQRIAGAVAGAGTYICTKAVIKKVASGVTGTANSIKVKIGRKAKMAASDDIK